MNKKEIELKVKVDLEKIQALKNWHGISSENISQFLVEPYEATVDPDDLETSIRNMWVVLHEVPSDPQSGYVVIYDPIGSYWGVATPAREAQFTLVIAANSLEEALNGM